MSIRSRLDLFFTDADMLPLMVEDSLAASMLKKNKYELQDIRNLAKAYDSICQGDVINKAIRVGQQRSLMPVQGFLSCVYPPELVAGSLITGKFPEWLGKNSTTRKLTRELRELKNVLSTAITGTNSSVKYDYCRPLLDMLLTPLEDDDIEAVMGLMDNYGLTPELIKDHLLDLQFNPRKLDLMAKVPAKTKGNLTRMWNKRHETSLKIKKAKQIGESDLGAKYNELLDELVEESGDEADKIELEDQQDRVEVQGK